MSAAKQSDTLGALARCAQALAVILELLGARLEQPGSQVSNLPPSPPPASADQLRSLADRLRSFEPSETTETAAQRLLVGIDLAAQANRQLLSGDSPPSRSPAAALAKDLERLRTQVRKLAGYPVAVFSS